MPTGVTEDHMMLFDTSDSSIGAQSGLDIVLAWEDSAYYIGSDYGYTGMVVGISDVTVVPEQTALLLFGTGLAGTAAGARRRREN